MRPEREGFVFYVSISRNALFTQLFCVVTYGDIFSCLLVFPDSSYSSAMLKYRTMRQLRPGAGLLGGFEYDCTFPTYGSMMLNGLVPSMGN